MEHALSSIAECSPIQCLLDIGIRCGGKDVSFMRMDRPFIVVVFGQHSEVSINS